MADKYFYRPLAFFGGKVLKCAGICDATNIDMANELYIERREDGYLPGFIILDAYRGDRIVVGQNNVAKEYKDGDPLPGEAVAAFEVRNVFGNDLIYPANEAAELFAKIAGKKTLDRADLKNIAALGFRVAEVTTKKLAA